MHLLILDDDKTICDFISTIAAERGWTVESCANEAQFHSQCLAHRPDAILLDLQLGATDGVEQLHYLHRLSYTGPVVLMSGFDQRVMTSAQSVGQSLGIQIACLLEKPARLARVRQVLFELESRTRTLAEESETSQVLHAQNAQIDISPGDIQQAIECGETQLYFQPIVAAANFAVVRLEALMRWHDPLRGLVMPDHFIAVAEQSEEVIDRLFTWVAESALIVYRQLAILGLPYPIAINVSGRNLHSRDFPDLVAALIENSGAPSTALMLEVTESVAMGDPGSMTDILTRLRLMGFELSLDDFGTGYSSLKALRQMPFSEIKIDRSFVADLQTSRDSLAIVKSVIDLARNMGLASVAEGVETESAARYLVELGVDFLQGYYFSRPLPFAELLKWLQKYSPSIASVEAKVAAGSPAGKPTNRSLTH
jgi:EAL domain-containing protein (putative c-di-GMP-specific phosphodiesterase class I)/FixJ family two-component response regulator